MTKLRQVKKLLFSILDSKDAAQFLFIRRYAGVENSYVEIKRKTEKRDDWRC